MEKTQIAFIDAHASTSSASKDMENLVSLETTEEELRRRVLLVSLSLKPTENICKDLIIIPDVMPISFKQPGDPTIYPMEKFKRPKKVVRLEKQLPDRVECTLEDGLKYFMKRALKIEGLDKEFEVPNVIPKNTMLWKCKFNAFSADKVIAEVKNFYSDRKVAVYPSNDNKLSLCQRLEGWTAEKKPRENSSVIDTFFYHEKTLQFRSKADVLRFLFYEISPGQKNKEAKKQKLTPPPPRPPSSGKGKGIRFL